jgi:hypothetical protein
LSRDDNRSPFPAEELLVLIERSAGHDLRSPEQIREMFARKAKERPGSDRAQSNRRIVREAILVSLLAVSLLQYHFWDVKLEIASLRALTISWPFSKPYPLRSSQLFERLG